MENYRPLKILHGYSFGEAGTDIGEKKRIIEKRIDDLREKGYGGIVTNVDMDQNYLHDAESWELFRHAVQYAVNQRGMKIWIYDEKGYPSGSAGGLTLRENPEYECKGLVLVKKNAAAGEKIMIEKPRGHLAVQAVYFIDCTGKQSDLSADTDADGTLRYTAEADGDVYYFVTKPLYEGTHAQHNTCASRRYISLTDAKAVGAFLENTYRAYTDQLEALRLPEGSIQAFFTDEPSLQACYLNKGLDPAQVDDPFDPELPLYPVVAWENGLARRYWEKYGEDLLPCLHFLFEGDCRRAKVTRYQFYTLISDLYEDAFYRQISEFCAEHGIAFSGHLLLEENLLHHAIFEGNFFNLTRHMHIPGIDMLFTKPENVLRFAETPKLLSSVAAWYGREHVMSEISGHTENALRIPFDINDIICAQLIQFVLGVDIFNSYFDDGSLTQEENRLLCDTVAKACKEFAGKTSMADVILYYPIESAQASVKGSDQQLYERPFDADAVACEESWRSSIDLLLRNHYMFDCADETVLAGADIIQEECCVRNPASGIRYHALVVPKLAAVTLSALELFQKCADCGIPVIVNDLSPAVTVLGTDAPEAGSNAVIRLLSSENVTNARSGEDALKSLQYILPPNIELIGDEGQVIALSKRDPDSGKISYIAVNTSNVSREIALVLDYPGPFGTKPPAGIPCMDAKNGMWTELPAALLPEDRICVQAKIPALGAYIFRF